MEAVYAVTKTVADWVFKWWKPGIRIMVAAYLIMTGMTLLAGGTFPGLPGLNMTLGTI